MILIYQIRIIIEFFLDIVCTIEFILFSILLILLYHVILYSTRDRKHISTLKKFDDVSNIKIENLKNIPLINIIVPAWNEGEIFKRCLSSITNLTYPNLKVIVNAGGNEETIQIAESFQKYNNFIIINQKEGGGKIKALNDAIKFVNEGIICLLDADIFLTNENVINMLTPILKLNEDIVISELRPHKSQIQRSLVRYLFINRNIRFREGFRRYYQGFSQLTFLKLEVYKNIGKFTEKRLIGDGQSMGMDTSSKGYKSYKVKSNIAQSFNFPGDIRAYFNQNIRWLENYYSLKFKNSKKMVFYFVLMVLISIYLVIFPTLIIVNLSLFIVGILILLYKYLKFIRKVIFFNKTENKQYFGKNRFSFFIKCLFYIYIDSLMNIYMVFEFILFGKKKFKQRKNIEY